MNNAQKLLEEKRNYLRFLNNQITDKTKFLEMKSLEFTQCLHSVELDKKSVEVVKMITEKMSAGGLNKIQELVSRGLQVIFTDENYSFKIEVSERGTSKTVEFFIIDSSGAQTPLERCGGGLNLISSFLMRVYMILKLNLIRFIALDEPFIGVSFKYTEGLMQFMQSLKTDLGFEFLWISHSSEYVQGADRIYEMVKGKPKLVESYEKLHKAVAS